MKRLTLALTFGLALVAAGATISAGDPAHSHHPPSKPAMAGAPSTAMPHDTRSFVKYPEALRIHTLAKMRDHLSAIAEIQDKLAKGSFDKASDRRAAAGHVVAGPARRRNAAPRICVHRGPCCSINK